MTMTKTASPIGPLIFRGRGDPGASFQGTSLTARQQRLRLSFLSAKYLSTTYYLTFLTFQKRILRVLDRFIHSIHTSQKVS